MKNLTSTTNTTSTAHTPKPEGMTGLEIKNALHTKGFTFQMMADELGCNSNVFTSVIYRRTVSRRAADMICLALGKPMHDVFPDVESYKKEAIPQGFNRAEKKAELRALLAN